MRRKPEKEACSLECISEPAPSAWPAMCVCKETETDRQAERLRARKRSRNIHQRGSGRNLHGNVCVAFIQLGISATSLFIVQTLRFFFSQALCEVL